MKIGYFCNSTNWDNKSYSQILNEIREIAIYCDKNSWDSIWFTEHHFSHEGMEICPNPILLSSDIAARTNNIRIGQAATIVTFWNPIRVAEDIALLDNLSRLVIDTSFFGLTSQLPLSKRDLSTAKTSEDFEFLILISDENIFCLTS